MGRLAGRGRERPVQLAAGFLWPRAVGARLPRLPGASTEAATSGLGNGWER